MFLASFHITVFINYVRLNCRIKFYLKTNNAFFLIQVFVLENAEGNFLHNSVSRVLVCRHAVWLNIFL